MALFPADIEPAALTVAARRTLLDALTALSQHLDALILVGAQAVYLRSQDADLGVAAYTSDGDISIDPNLLQPDPRLESLLTGAGFTRDALNRQPQPGIWFRNVTIDGQPVPIEVDLLAAESLAEGRRSAHLPPHDPAAVRRVAGIELALEDNDLLPIPSLDPSDPREISVRVAGVAALLVAKAYKIHDRSGSKQPGRRNDKDAADVYRIITTANAYQVAETLAHLSTSPRVGPIAVTGLQLLQDHFGSARSLGITMAARALGVDPDRIARTATAFIAALHEDT